MTPCDPNQLWFGTDRAIGTQLCHVVRTAAAIPVQPSFWVVILLMWVPIEVLGCSICVTAMTDTILPPIELWVLIATSWFISNGAVRSSAYIKLPLQPSKAGSITTAVFLWMLGAGIVGLWIVLILLVPPICSLLISMRKGIAGQIGAGIRSLRTVAKIHVALLGVAVTSMTYTHLTRTPEQYLCKWGFNGPGQQLFQELRENEPRSLEAYRFLVAHADGTIVNAVAERLGEIGDPELDVPLLEAASIRFKKQLMFMPDISESLHLLKTRQTNAVQRN